MTPHAPVLMKPGGDRAVRHRVLSWLHAEQPGTARTAANAKHGTAVLVEQHSQERLHGSIAESAQPGCTTAVHPQQQNADLVCQANQPGPPPHKRAAQLWKKWKTMLRPNKAAGRLSSKVLHQHDSLVRSTDDCSTIMYLPPQQTTHHTATAVPAAAADLADGREAMPAAAAAAARAGLPAAVVTAYHSSLYNQSTPCSSVPTTPRAQKPSVKPPNLPPGGSRTVCSAIAPLAQQQPGQVIAAVAMAPDGVQPQWLSLRQQPSPASDSGHAMSGMAKATCWQAAPAVQHGSPHSAVSAGHCSSPELQNEYSTGSGMASSGALLSPHTPAAAEAPASGAGGRAAVTAPGMVVSNSTSSSGTASAALFAMDTSWQQRHQHTMPTAGGGTPTATGKSVAAVQLRGAQARQERGGRGQVEQQPPWAQQTTPSAAGVDMSDVAAVCSSLTGTAMTAYPAVAAALQGRGLGLEGHHGNMFGAADGAAWAVRHRSTGAPGKPAPAAGSRAAAPCMVSGASLAGMRGTAEVSRWLLRTALLEDELQGRALEVREQLADMAERKEALEALLLSMHGCMQGGKVAAAAAAAAAAGPEVGLDLTGVLHSISSASGNGGQVNAVRQKLSQELSSVSADIGQLTARAASLGAGLACLQGCQTVMHGSRGARLTPASKVAVLQLVLGDVVARLPDERLHELEVCQGLPALDSAGQQLCSLAAEGSTAGLDGEHSAAAAAAAPASAPALVPAEVIEDENGVAALVAVGAGPVASSAACSPMLRQSSAASYCPPAGGPVAADTPRTNSSVLRQSVAGPSSSAHCGDRQQQQQQQQQHRSEAQSSAAGSSFDDDEDDDVIVTLSSVLSTRHYTPRPSLAYESRRASLAYESRRVSLSAPVPPVPGSQPAVGRDKAAGASGTSHGGYWSVSRSNGDLGTDSTSRRSAAEQPFWRLQPQQQPAASPCSAAAAAAKELLLTADDAAADNGGRLTASVLAAAQMTSGGALGSVPETGPDVDRTWLSAADSECGSMGSDGTTCFTALSQPADCDETSAMHSTSDDTAAEWKTRVANPHAAALETVSVMHVPAAAWPAASAGQPANLLNQSVQQLLPSGGGDLGSMTVGQLLHSLTQAVMQHQRQSMAHSSWQE